MLCSISKDKENNVKNSHHFKRMCVETNIKRTNKMQQRNKQKRWCFVFYTLINLIFVRHLTIEQKNNNFKQHRATMITKVNEKQHIVSNKQYERTYTKRKSKRNITINIERKLKIRAACMETKKLKMKIELGGQAGRQADFLSYQIINRLLI